TRRRGSSARRTAMSAARARYVVVGLLLLGAVGAAEAAAPPAKRADSFGDPLPDGAVARLGTVRWRHLGCHVFAFTRSGEALLSADHESVRVWDVGTGKVLRSVAAKVGFSHQLPVSPDGAFVVAGDPLEVALFDVKTGRAVWRMEGSKKRFTSV